MTILKNSATPSIFTMNTYHVYKDGDYQEMTVEELFTYEGQGIWSARISTGLFGKTDCSAGNRGPKNDKEVILAIGDEGLEKLIDLGFITCPVCKPEETEAFWETIEPTVKDTYGLTTLEDFTDKDLLTYDSRRLDWESILAVTGDAPGRIYLPEGLEEKELKRFKDEFQKIGVTLPPVGYYDAEAETRFTEYDISAL